MSWALCGSGASTLVPTASELGPAGNPTRAALFLDRDDDEYKVDRMGAVHELLRRLEE